MNWVILGSGYSLLVPFMPHQYMYAITYLIEEFTKRYDSNAEKLS